MANGFFTVPAPKNEPVKSYAPGSPERAEVEAKLKAMRAEVADIPMYIGGQEVRTDTQKDCRPPHDHQHLLARYHYGDKGHVEQAVTAALNAKAYWENLPWEHRAGIFMRAAELLATKYRADINAATMLGQSKNVHQAEIDAACELIDFLRFNVSYMADIYGQQPQSHTGDGIWNRMEHRALEGFILAITPFNFTAIAGNLPSAPAMMGNCVVWKPAETQVYSAQVIMKAFIEAGLPDGVINLIYAEGPDVGDVVFEHPDFAGLHFTGSTGVFQHLWKTIGNNIHKYRSYPRIVGETGGKDFLIAHKSAHARPVATALIRASYEFQGQKCSAASRAYIPSNLWEEVRKYMLEDLKDIKMGPPEVFSNFVNAVIDERAFDKIARYIDQAKADGVEVVAGGNYDKSKGYFVEPTILKTEDPQYTTMEEEIFGPVLTVYVYDAEKFEDALTLLDQTSPYALTGAVFSQDRYAAELAETKLRHAAGNFYINDKPTGSVVGQQPFGGARGSGTNDKAGAVQNLLRWVSPRAIKENFNPPTDYRYPFLG